MEVDEAEVQAKLMDKRMSLQMRKCVYSQNFSRKDVVPNSQKSAQGQKLLDTEDEV